MEAAAIGAVIGERYRLEEELGGGAMGCVFRASVIAGGEDVAIKVIAPELVGRAGLVERLEREALLVRGVEHPAIRRVHECGTTDDGVPFLVSELLEGESLDERLSREPVLTGADMLQITIDVLDGLEAVHAAGVVHRDMKPDNIFIDRDGAPKIIDFGVSKGALAGASLTITGEILGTPVFMSPEQADHARGATPAADVYGVGAILYDALAGRPPFEAPSLGMLLLAVAFEDPAPLADVRPGVPPALVALVAQAMAKAPAERPMSADAFATSLRVILEAHGAELAALELPRTDGQTPDAAEAAAISGAGSDSGTALDPDAVPELPRRRGAGLAVAGVAAFLLMMLAVVVFALL